MATSGSVAKLKPLPSMIAQQPDEVYLHNMDETEVLAGLADKTNAARRALLIDELRASVRRNGGRLMFEDRHALFHVFQGALCDSDPNARLRCIEFISEIIPEFGLDLDNCMSLVLPQLVSNLGNHTVTVKKSAIQTLHVYMKTSSNIGAVFNAIIEHGLESQDKRTRAESLVALPILITPNLAHEDLFVLTKALVARLESSSRPEPTVLSLDRIRNVVGQEKFQEYIHRLPSHQQKLCLEAIEEYGSIYKGDSLEIPELRKAKSAGQLNSNGVVEFDGVRNGDKQNLDRGHTIAVSKGYATRESMRMGDEGVEFGFVPRPVVAKLRDQSNWRIRAQGIEELKIVMGHLSDTSAVMPHLASLFGLLLDFLDDLNFKITVTSLQIIGLLVAKLGVSVGPFLKPLVGALANKLGDNKIVIRQENMKALMQLMQILSPKPVLSVLTSSLQHPKSKVREETLNVVIGALLTFPRSDFDLPELTKAIAPALADSKRKVRQAALEAFAVIAQAMGPAHLQPIVSAVDAVELTRSGDGVMAAVQARLARRQLPRLNSDGLVEYAIPVPSSGTVRGQSNIPRGADIEWVLAGTGGAGLAENPNSARSTPGLNDSMNNSGPSPRRYFSAGKNRLPWEESKDLNQESREQVPPPVRNSWVPGEIVSDRTPKRKAPQGMGSLGTTPSSAPSSTSKLSSTGYADKYLARMLHQATQGPDAHSKSDSAASYADIYKSKMKKEKTRGSYGSPGSASSGAATHPGASAGSNGGGGGATGGSYALLYKRGTIQTKAKASSSAEPALGEGSAKETVLRGTQSATPTGLQSHGAFSPMDEELFSSQRKNFSNALSNSWPDWTEAHSPGRPWGRLSPVSHGPTADNDASFEFDSDNKRNDPATPVHIKPQLARSATKTRLKNQELVDDILGIDQLDSSLNRTTPLAPVTSGSGVTPDTSFAQPPTDSLKTVHKHAATKRALKMYSAVSDSDDGGTRTPSPSEYSNGITTGLADEPNSEVSPMVSSPFNNKPRIARTPVKTRRLSSDRSQPSPPLPGTLDAEGLGITGYRIKSKDISGKNSILGPTVGTDRTSESGTSGIGSSVMSGEDLREVSVVGQGLLRKEASRADSLEGKVVSGKEKNEKLEYEPEESEEEEEGSDEEEEEEDEDEEEENEEEEEDNEEEEEGEYEEEDDDEDKILDELSNGESSESDDEDEIDRREGLLERDMTPKTMRKSLSKSTRERMERKKKEEEEKAIKEQHRVDVLEQERSKLQAQQKEEEDRLRKKIMKEQRELEKMLQKKEKERLLERQKQKQLQEQLQQQEKALREKLQKQQEELEDIEREKQVEKEREKERSRERTRQKQLRQQREKEEAERKEAERLKEEIEVAGKLEAAGKLKQKKEDELRKKLALEEAERRKRQQQAAKEPKEVAEDPDLSVTGSSTPIKQSSGRTPRKKPHVSSAQSERDAGYAVTQDPSDARRHHIASASSGSSTAAIWEITLDDLQPFNSPDMALRDALKCLANTEDWEMKCEGLQCMRRLTKHHPDTITVQLHAVMLAVGPEVKNLRSQVSRAAICCLADMFTCLGRQMDPELEYMCKILLTKSGETSGFIREDTEKCMLAMICNVTATRALVAITSTGCGHRNVAIRKTAAQFLSILAERIGANRLMSGAKDVTDRILPAAAQFATDNGSDTRYYGRKILFTIYDHPEFDRLVTKHVPANLHRQVRDIVENLKTKGLPNDVSSARHRKNPGSGSHSRSNSGTGGTGGTSGKGIRSSTDGSVVPSPASSRESSRTGRSAPQDTHIQGEEILPEIQKCLASNDWKERIQGLDMFVALADRNRGGLGAKFTKAFDVLIPRLQDSNSKVNLHALQCLPRIIPSLSSHSGALVPPLVAALTANLASKNSGIFNAADECLTVLTKHIDNTTLVQPFCTTSQYGNSRVKPVMIDKLCLIVDSVHARKPQVIQRYVLPLLWNLLGAASTGSAGAGTSDVKSATVRLSSTLYSCMGRSLVDAASSQPPRIRERLKDIVEDES